ncbi:thioredoxin fold domain-containing protein [bacterium]|nr:thioredoxin fold domain-containing protein [bacterium]
MRIFYFLIGLTALIATGTVRAQEGFYEPVEVSYSLEYPGNNELVVVVKLAIEEGWHTYSLMQDNPYGPLATVLTVKDSSVYKKSGKAYSPSKLHKEYEPAFEMEIESYEKEAIFKQNLKLTGNTNVVKGIFEYQVCNNERCLPPYYLPFEIPVKSGYYLAQSTRAVNHTATDPEEAIEFGTAETGHDEAIEGEMLDPVSWTFTAQNLGNNLVEITATPTMDEGWHLYADLGQDIPIATTFWIKDSLDGYAYEPQGKNEVHPALAADEKHMDETFGVEVAYLRNKHSLKHRVLLKKGISRINGALEYQTCDDHQCLPPTTVDFVVEVDESWYDPNAATLSSGDEAEQEEDLAKIGWWALFLRGFGGGFIALLTPCVFPMIPMTVNFFMKQSGNRTKGISNAFLYGLSIIFIYTSIGFGLTKGLGSDVMNQMASSITMNILFFIVFIIFGMSFLGAFEINLPTWIVNSSDKQADKGGLIGIFFMAFTLAVVSFSCTGPIIGSLLVLAAQGGNDAGPLAGMLGFSTALALPFTLFAIFPSWLAGLPKSGGWLNSVKVVLGLLEFALAMKFLSNVDLAYHWELLSREVFISIWVVIFIIIGFYLIGKLKFSHDSDLPYISVPRILFSIVAFAFAVYLIPGLWGAPLKLMSGLAPPRAYVEDVNWMRRGTQVQVAAVSVAHEGGEALSSGEDCPNGLPCTKDYAEALAYAKKVNKPIFVDFTGHTCVNCRKMEENTWNDPKIDKILRNDYVVVSLYVDDKKMLPKEEQKTVDLFGKDFKIRTYGNKWTYMQASKYKTNSQPYYVLLSPDEEVLAKPRGYTPDVDEYEAFLKSGLEALAKK